MIELIVVAVILIIIMLVFVFILFKNIIKNINVNAKKYFVNKLQNYDYLLEEKQTELDNIKVKLDEIESQKNILDKNNDKELYNNIKQSQKAKDKVDKEIDLQFDLKTPEYRETQFFNNYKEIKKIFTVDNENIIKDFIKEHKNDNEIVEYKALKDLRSKFDNNSIYGCLTLDRKDQISLLNEVLTDTEKKLVHFDKMIQSNKFNIKELIKYIEQRLEEIDPVIYIYTNGLDKRYDLIDENIVMKQYNNMSEGIIIKYRNKIYDYSI